MCTDFPNCTSLTGNLMPYFIVSAFNCFTKLSNDLLVPRQTPMQSSMNFFQNSNAWIVFSFYRALKKENISNLTIQGVYLIPLDISSLIQTKLSAVLRSSLFLWFPRGVCIMFYQLELFTGL